MWCRRVAHRLAAGDRVGVAGLQHAALDQQRFGPRERLVAVGEIGISIGETLRYSAMRRLAVELRGQAIDRHVDAMPAHPQRRRTRLGQRQGSPCTRRWYAVNSAPIAID